MELINLIISDDPNDKSGVSAIALVDSPAIEEGWMAFNKQNPNAKLVKHTIFLGSEKGNFNPVQGDQQILAGPLMIPNKEIYRKDGEREFNVIFSTEMVKKIRDKYSLSNRNTAVNQMHNNATPVQGGLIQHFIIDRKRGIMPPKGFEHLEDGTWYGEIKVNDKSVWDTFVKTGIYTGFSVEGHFYEQPDPGDEQDDEEQGDIFKDLIDHLKSQGVQVYQ